MLPLWCEGVRAVTKIVPAVALLVIFCAIVLLVWTATQWSRGDPQIAEILAHPSALNRWADMRASEPDRSVQTEPLVTQARLLALYLVPPTPERSSVEPRPPVRPPAPVRSAAPVPYFQLCATSYYPSQPDKSMALIGESQNPRRAAQWVKAGSPLGHLVVQEVRRGSILCRDGDRLVEMRVPRETVATPLVRSHGAGLAQADAALSNLVDVENDSVAE
jgi:hypothetical protein